MYLPPFTAGSQGYWQLYDDGQGHDVISEGSETQHRHYVTDMFNKDTTAPGGAGQVKLNMCETDGVIGNDNHML